LPALVSTRMPKAFKGVELYSWKDKEAWLFALLPGTNRLKTEEEIKRAPSLGLLALKKRVGILAEGEEVFWNSPAGFERPDQKTREEILSAAKRAKIKLQFGQ